jgi:spermidine synthase
VSVRFGEQVAEGFFFAFEGTLVHSERSSFQKIEVYDHPHFGRVLTLDDTIQTTERDEFCYHELLVHPALCARDLVERVLIIGGGDGGTLRHVLMHAPDEVVMCEIDGAVVRVSREHLPALAGDAFDDPRATVVIDDGAAFVERHEDAFDAILVDCTDPVGAALVLFSREFYTACRRALRPGGVIVSQTGTPVYQPDEFQTAINNMSEVFPGVEPYLGFVPTYPGAAWSFASATTGASLSSTSASDVDERLKARGIATRYYTGDVHAACFALPAFVAELLKSTHAATVSRG